MLNFGGVNFRVVICQFFFPKVAIFGGPRPPEKFMVGARPLRKGDSD